ncbi:hypothetical protein NDU88_007324 [Pleurodeles waltl]|uniref:Uncharacterized protein n=1 Tax=Pleurodeles waltl TaxID=8319 RepID=A0AAV7U165_PLEWA|nr:hypothetical protein NDU88_007324 [Pleurodeles waltl]
MTRVYLPVFGSTACVLDTRVKPASFLFTEPPFLLRAERFGGAISSTFASRSVGAFIARFPRSLGALGIFISFFLPGRTETLDRSAAQFFPF